MRSTEDPILNDLAALPEVPRDAAAAEVLRRRAQLVLAGEASAPSPLLARLSFAWSAAVLPALLLGFGSAYAWASPLHELNCEIIWPLALDELTPDNANLTSDVETEVNSYLELDTPEYAGAIKDAWLVEKLLAMGGIRLAATLNYLFTTQDAAPLYLGN